MMYLFNLGCPNIIRVLNAPNESVRKKEGNTKTNGNSPLIMYLRNMMIMTDVVTDKDDVHNYCRLQKNRRQD